MSCSGICEYDNALSGNYYDNGKLGTVLFSSGGAYLQLCKGVAAQILVMVHRTNKKEEDHSTLQSASLKDQTCRGKVLISLCGVHENNFLGQTCEGDCRGVGRPEGLASLYFQVLPEQNKMVIEKTFPSNPMEVSCFSFWNKGRQLLKVDHQESGHGA